MGGSGASCPVVCESSCTLLLLCTVCMFDLECLARVLHRLRGAAILPPTASGTLHQKQKNVLAERSCLAEEAPGLMVLLCCSRLRPTLRPLIACILQGLWPPCMHPLHSLLLQCRATPAPAFQNHCSFFTRFSCLRAVVLECICTCLQRWLCWSLINPASQPCVWGCLHAASFGNGLGKLIILADEGRLPWAVCTDCTDGHWTHSNVLPLFICCVSETYSTDVCSYTMMCLQQTELSAWKRCFG